MAYSEKTLEQIHKYVSGEMSTQEKRAFEIAMTNDNKLQQEVKLYAEMENFFSNTDEKDLRSNLKKLGDEYVPPTPNRKGNVWKYLILLFPALLIAGLAFLFLKDNVDETPKVRESKKTPHTIENTEVPIETIEEPIQETGIKPNVDEKFQEEKPIAPKPQTKAKSPEEKTTSDEPKYQLIAANFEANPQLDFLIENNLRSGEDELIIRNRQADQLLQNLDDAVPFAFVAKLKSQQDLSQSDFKLYIFSNKKADFENFTTLHTFNVKPSPTKDNAYQLIVSNNLTLEPGLYYYLLEDFAKEKTYFVEKFEVNFQ